MTNDSNKKTYLPALDKVADYGPIKEIVLPKEGGIKTYYQGFDKYPYAGYLSREASKTIEFIKRAFILMVENLVSMKRTNLFQLIFLKRIIQRFIPKWLNFAVWVMRDVKLKPELYSHSVREIHRLFNVLIEQEGNQAMKDKWQNIRDITCMILEVDRAYRFRFQDIISQINIDEIKLDEADRYFASLMSGNYNFGKKNENSI